MPIAADFEGFSDTAKPVANFQGANRPVPARKMSRSTLLPGFVLNSLLRDNLDENGDN